MEARTHWLGGLTAGAVAASAMNPPHLLVFLGVAMLAGPLPDLDHPGSTYGRYVPLPRVARVDGQVVPYQGGRQPHFGHVGFRTPLGIGWHRGGYHSVAGALVTALGFGALAHWIAPSYTTTVALAVLVGFCSHLVLDGFNQMGQALAWPLRRQRYHLGWPRFRVGSAGETLLTAVLLGAVVWWGLGVLPHLVAHVASAGLTSEPGGVVGWHTAARCRGATAMTKNKSF